MKKITYEWISGILTALLVLGGTTYYIQDTGSKGRCSTGWQLMEEGEFEGQYKCQTASSLRYETCFEVYNSANTENYWCKKGVLVKVEEEESIPQKSYSASQEERIHMIYGGIL